MKKGIEKKHDFLLTAEQMFCRYGYSKTSIQMILDELNTSKGSFYHHFESKEKLLEEICLKRASAVTNELISSSDRQTTVLSRLNTILSGLIPLNGERLNFILMLLPVFSLPEGWTIQHKYCAALSASLKKKIVQIVEDGNGEGVFICHKPEYLSEILLMLTNDLWCRICDEIIHYEMSGQLCDQTELLAMINSYRLSAERLLSAPYGSIQLISFPELKLLTEQIHTHWK